MPQPSASNAPLAALRCTLDYSRLDDFVARYGRNLSRAGVFLPMREPLDVGSSVRFEILIADGTAVLRGDGVVTWRAPYEPGAPDRLHGMGVRFTRLDSHSREVIERVTAYKTTHRDTFYEPARDAVLAPPTPFAFIAPASPVTAAPQVPVPIPTRPVEAAKPVEAPKAVEAPKPAEAAKPVEAPKPVEAAKPVATPKPADAPKPIDAPKPVDPPRVAAPAPSARTPLISAKTAAPSSKTPLRSAKTPIPAAATAQNPASSAITPVLSAQTPKPTRSSAVTPLLTGGDAGRPRAESAATPKVDLTGAAAATAPRRTPRSADSTPAVPAAGGASSTEDELASLRSPSRRSSGGAQSADALKKLQDMLGRRPPGSGKD